MLGTRWTGMVLLSSIMVFAPAVGFGVGSRVKQIYLPNVKVLWD